jgi:hypothetical protein
MCLSSSRYADRFAASAYADDEPVGVFVSEDDLDAVWVPERLFFRLKAVAEGYELHLLPLLGGREPMTLNADQMHNLLDELDFLRALLTADQLIAEQVERLSLYLSALLRHPGASVTVEGG